jgi:nicotinate-nucleotide adenylyltransferase
MKRYGIFGGSFNPPHIAHSILAEDVREQMHLDKIIFIPTGNHALKNNLDSIDPEHRLNMAKLAFEKDEHFEVSDIEISNLKEKSYTVDTLIKLKEKYKNDFVKLYLILGIDTLIEFPKWKDPNKLFLLSEIVILNRPNLYVQDVHPDFSNRVKYLSVPMLEISSSMIREYIQQNKSIKYLVDKDVQDYIETHNLYKI